MDWWQMMQTQIISYIFWQAQVFSNLKIACTSNEVVTNLDYVLLQWIA
jgi:hypothetical protein